MVILLIILHSIIVLLVHYSIQLSLILISHFVVNRVSLCGQALYNYTSMLLKEYCIICKALLSSVIFKPSSHLLLQGFSYIDWASCVDDRRSDTSMPIFYSANPVMWCSHKQPTISRSSTEANYHALAIVISEMTWLQLCYLNFNSSC